MTSLQIMPAYRASTVVAKPPPRCQEQEDDYESLTDSNDSDEVADASEAGTSDRMCTYYDRLNSVAQESTNTSHCSGKAQLSVCEDCQPTSFVSNCVISQSLMFNSLTAICLK